MNESILFVDDDPGITSMLKRLFHRSAYRVNTVNHAAEALALLERDTFNVIVVDQHMPSMDGFTLIDKAHQRQPKAIKMMFSGYLEAHQHYSEQACDNIHQFIQKPCFDEEFIDYIDSAVLASLANDATAMRQHALE